MDRLYIDGELVDINAQEDITLEVKSNVFSDLSKISGNSTFTFKLPKTTRNRTIFGYADKMDEQHGTAYRAHRANMYRDAVEVIKNGSAMLSAATQDAYEVVITWGVCDKLKSIADNGWTLQDIKSEAALQFDEYNALTELSTLQANGYGYVGFDTANNTIKESGWRNNYDYDYGHKIVIPVSGGGERGSSGRVFTDWTTKHPSALVSWLLTGIKSLTGVEFKWTGAAKSVIDNLCVPCVTKTANYLTFAQEKATGTLVELPMGYFLNKAVFNVGSNSVVFGNIPAGTRKEELEVLTDATIHVRCNIGISTPWRGILKFRGFYLIHGASMYLYVRHTDGSEDKYNIGYGGDIQIPAEEVISNVFIETLTAEGDIDVVAGDKIYFKGTSGTAYGDVQKTFTGGFEMAANIGNDVPYGGIFPIIANMPNIKIIDFIKFLSVITGTFAKQITDGGVVEFVALDAFDTANALDWTGRLIAADSQNIPPSVAFSMSEWARVNWYKWKEDEETSGNYDGALVISNENLESERDVMQFPFAASDGGKVPLYRYEWELNEDDEWERTETFVKVEPRILELDPVTVVRQGVEHHYALTKFGLAMGDIIRDKYNVLQGMLDGCKVIEETIMMSNAEVADFDECVPVWLGQYGAYWVVMEIRAAKSGQAKVKMVKLNMGV